MLVRSLRLTKPEAGPFLFFLLMSRINNHHSVDRLTQKFKAVHIRYFMFKNFYDHWWFKNMSTLSQSLNMLESENFRNFILQDLPGSVISQFKQLKTTMVHSGLVAPQEIKNDPFGETTSELCQLLATHDELYFTNIGRKPIISFQLSNVKWTLDPIGGHVSASMPNHEEAPMVLVSDILARPSILNERLPCLITLYMKSQCRFPFAMQMYQK